GGPSGGCASTFGSRCRRRCPCTSRPIDPSCLRTLGGQRHAGRFGRRRGFPEVPAPSALFLGDLGSIIGTGGRRTSLENATAARRGRARSRLPPSRGLVPHPRDQTSCEAF